MPGEIKSLLVRALQNIDPNNLKSFKNKLCDAVVPGFPTITLSALKNKDAEEELVDHILRHYTDEHAPELVVKLLQDINERQVSLELQDKCKNVVSKDEIPESGQPLVVPKDEIPESGQPPVVTKEENSERGQPSVAPMDGQVSSVETRHQVRLRESNELEHHQPIAGTSSSQISQGEEQPGAKRKRLARKAIKMESSSPERGKPLPDIKLIPLTERHIRIMKENHKDNPCVYARLLFKHFVPFNTCKNWAAQKVNFDGYRGKRAIPSNLLDAIMDEVRKTFGDLDPDIKKEIQKKFNGLLKNPPKKGWPRLF